MISKVKPEKRKNYALLLVFIFFLIPINDNKPPIKNNQTKNQKNEKSNQNQCRNKKT